MDASCAPDPLHLRQEVAGKNPVQSMARTYGSSSVGRVRVRSNALPPKLKSNRAGKSRRCAEAYEVVIRQLGNEFLEYDQLRSRKRRFALIIPPDRIDG